MTTATLQERVQCPRCHVRSIFVNQTLRIKDVDGHTIVITDWQGLTVECKCGSRYTPA